MLPGKHLIRYLLRHTQSTFSVLGQDGRNFHGSHYTIAAPSLSPEPVSFICRGYLVNTMDLPKVLDFANSIGIPKSYFLDDDILLSSALHQASGILPRLGRKPEEHEKMNLIDLPENNAVWKIPGHFERRIKLLNQLNFSIHKIPPDK
jgi:hypothetical protein